MLPVGVWRDTGVLTATTWDEYGQENGTIHLRDMIGTTGRVEFRVVGSMTKPSGTTSQATVFFRTEANVGKGGWGFGRNQDGGTFDATELEYQPTGSVGTDPRVFTIDAVNAQRISAEFVGKNTTSTLRVQVRRIA
jgi:hypothetical protein